MKKGKAKTPGWVRLLLLFIILTIAASIWVFIQAPNWEKDFGNVGTVGDFFNGMLAPFIAFIGALLTFAAFFVQYQANADQRAAIAKQEEEMKLARRENKQDNFNSIFFNLLKSQRELRMQLDVTVPRPTNHIHQEVTFNRYQNIEALNALKIQVHLLFQAFRSEQFDRYDDDDLWNYLSTPVPDEDYNGNSYETIPQNYFDRLNNSYLLDYYLIRSEETWKKGKDMDDLNCLRFAYSLVYYKYSNTLSPYFRHLYHLLRFLKIRQNEMIEEEKQLSLDAGSIETKIREEFRQYATFIQAQMLPVELLITFYNALCFPKTLALLQEFQLLENLEEEELVKIKSGRVPGINFKKKRNLVDEALKGDLLLNTVQPNQKVD